MAAGRKRTPPKTLFGKEASRLLEEKCLQVTDVSERMGVSASYAYGVLRGDRPASPAFVNALASVVPGADDETKNKLNTAAAVDAGFELKLPEGW